MVVNMFKIVLKCILLGVVFINIVSCSSDEVKEVSEYVPVPPGLVPEYRIGVDDTVRVTVWRNQDLGVTVPVRPDGMISVPLIGDVRAGGLSANQVSKNIEKQLGTFIRDPNVTVIVTGLRSHEYLTRVRITGAVTQPISINYRQGMTVLDAVLAAGGVNDFASANKTKLYRTENKKTVVISIYLDDILFDGQLETNIHIKPGDIITVPERIF